MVRFDSGAAWLPAIAVAVAITGAAILLAAGRLLPRLAVDLFATAVAAAVTALSAVVLAAASSGHVVAWAAGWLPKHGFSVGVVFVADPVGAGAATVAGALTTAALMFSWRYFESLEAHYHALMLLFLAGMEGFALTGDLFDMFVWFELMGASAYALTGMQIEDETAVQGGFNFGVVNSLGAYVSLMGVAFLYARTGNLGLPQLHRALVGHPADALVVLAFALTLTGFLVKAAVAPFHFWLADAHAVAPPPVCVLFSGIMVPLGVYAVFRVEWVVFAGTLPEPSTRRLFLVLGILTAVVGAVMCVAQRHLKRLLAYSTISHVGLFVCALGLLNRDGTAGALVYAAGHAGVKAALFLVAGVLLLRYGTVDEHELFGRARRSKLLAVCWVVGGLALAGLPPFGTALGKALCEEAAAGSGFAYLIVLYVLVAALTGGAVLRAGARVFAGWGPLPEEESSGGGSSKGDEQGQARLTSLPVSMALPIVVLLLASLACGLMPGMRSVADRAAAIFVHPPGYAAAALEGVGRPVLVDPRPNWTGLGVGLSLVSVLLGLVVAAAGLYQARLQASLRALCRLGAPALGVLRRLHSGHVGDYVVWLVTGVVLLLAFVGLPLVGH